MILESIAIARENWKGWQEVFEHRGPICTNPLISDPGHQFASFCKEYGVSRTVRAGGRDGLRLRLMSPGFLLGISDGTGHGLDELERDFRTDFGTCGGRRRMTSILSKVATFFRPERFVAWDKYAKKGINLALGRPAYRPFATYAAYLSAFDCVWEGQLGQHVRASMRDHTETERRPHFQRRVLDVCLMTLGDRTFGAVSDSTCHLACA
jgi:hypothetical protein